MTEYNNIQSIYSIAFETQSVHCGHVSNGFMTICSKKELVWDH